MLYIKHVSFLLVLIKIGHGIVPDSPEIWLNERIEKLKNLSEPYVKTEEIENFERELYNVNKSNQTYDFIIIGGGTAGATLAARLSEIKQFNILLLEAGDYEDEITKIPALSLNLLPTKYNWGYTTTPQKNWCYNREDKKCPFACGKALGGSSAINGMLWARGHRHDYDSWSEKIDSKEWSYDEILPYFKKLEKNNIKHYEPKFQGKNGKVSIENPKHVTKIEELVLRAAYELGIPYINYNTGDRDFGISHAQGTLKNGKRFSSASAYLNDEERPNLKIQTDCTVLKVLIDENTKIAYGVQYLHRNELYEVHATKEVILSAGGVNTPKILMISGIGPKSQLENFNIKTISNLNVGSNLRTHIAFPGFKIIFNGISSPIQNFKNEIREYLRNGRGPLTSFSSDLIGYFKEDNTTKHPEIELTFSTKNGNELGITVVLLHPKSRGNLTLTSNDPVQVPSINPNHLTHEDDLRKILSGVRTAERFLQTKIFKKHAASLYFDPKLNECYVDGNFSNSFWECAIKRQSICLSDPSGSVRMGKTGDDPETIVDNKLKVIGIKNLRVVDNSVIPVSIGGHMMAPAYMIGEKAADLIKFFWKDKK